ncbi:hypothetical protein ACFOKF_11950 [Sphingobium rhizovicinum]|uniref:Uncharacterized protein n=1 Tax=Sphingobium rhizovicinum TaxID=432308 RepID=A0ABV7NHC6_9SPHN
MTLDARARTKVSAALSLIALHGHNPRTVQEVANQRIAAGQPANLAYTFALNAFADKVPAIRPMMEIALDLIQNSDDATIATYDKALAAFNETGDTAHLDAITPMILEDAKALAVQNGEVSAEDAAGWDIEDALGFSEDAFAEMPDVPDAASPVPPSEYQAALEGPQQAGRVHWATAASLSPTRPSRHRNMPPAGTPWDTPQPVPERPSSSPADALRPRPNIGQGHGPTQRQAAAATSRRPAATSARRQARRPDRRQASRWGRKHNVGPDPAGCYRGQVPGLLI